MTKKNIFNYTIKDGISSFERDIVKLLIEDEDFFKRYINYLDQNWFNFEEFRTIVGRMKDYYNLYGIHLSPDVLLIKEKSINDKSVDIEILEASLEMCSNSVITPERRAEIENEVAYLGLFKTFMFAINHGRDTAMSGISNMSQLESAARKLIEDAGKVKFCLDTMNKNSNYGRNDWD